MSTGKDRAGTAREYALFEWYEHVGTWAVLTTHADAGRLEEVRANYARVYAQQGFSRPMCIVPVGEDVERERASLEAEIERLRGTVRATLESLEWIEREILPEGHRFASWSHPAIRMRMARAALDRRGEGD